MTQRSLMLSRRALLGAGLGGAAATLLPYLPRARADVPAIPTRILFVYGMGSIRALWPPLPVGGAPAPTETSWALGELHAPLAGHESDLLIIDGLDMRVADLTQPGMPNGHQNGGIPALTAAMRMTSSLANGVSIDQFIAQRINSPQPITRLPSLELGTGDNGGDVEGGPHYQSPGQIISPERNPMNAYQRVFGGFVPPDDSAAQRAAANTLVERSSVLDFAAKEIGRVSRDLAAADRTKLEAHAQVIRDYEARLRLVPPPPSSSCRPPDASYQADLGRVRGDPLLGFDVDARLMTAAFSCDLTRVGTIHLPTHYDLEPTIGYQAGMFGTTDSHDLTHQTNRLGATLWDNADAMAMIKQVHLHQARMFASLLDYLKSIPEPDGKTLLDHTVVLWCGQIAEGGHSLSQLPWILAGSAGGRFRTGRYLKLPRPNDQGPAHNDLFVSLAQAMGVMVDSFGEASVCHGPLAGLT
jgi:hypothetical protein